MMKILITGGHGFLGRNLATHLRERKECEVTIFGRGASLEDLRMWLLDADVIFHLAGINRPQDPSEFESGNAEFTEQLCHILRAGMRSPKIIFSSSIQAEISNPYGISKAKAENALQKFASDTGAQVRIYRLNNLFGKWARPNYNSVVATFCHNIANDLPISISNPVHEVHLSYVDDVVAAFLGELDGQQADMEVGADIRIYPIQLGDLAKQIQMFRSMRSTLMVPDLGDWFNRALYATYLSYVPPAVREYDLDIKSDARGSLAEFIKQEHFGQIFVSRTGPGVTRGNHYHHTKTEKFLVVEGEGLIRMRAVEGGPVTEYKVKGDGYQVIDIPPGFTHSIANVGLGELVTLFWSSEIFDPNHLDTYYLPVDFEVQTEILPLGKT